MTGARPLSIGLGAAGASLIIALYLATTLEFVGHVGESEWRAWATTRPQPSSVALAVGPLGQALLAASLVATSPRYRRWSPLTMAATLGLVAGLILWSVQGFILVGSYDARPPWHVLLPFALMAGGASAHAVAALKGDARPRKVALITGISGFVGVMGLVGPQLTTFAIGTDIGLGRSTVLKLIGFAGMLLFAAGWLAVALMSTPSGARWRLAGVMLPVAVSGWGLLVPRSSATETLIPSAFVLSGALIGRWWAALTGVAFAACWSLAEVVGLSNIGAIELHAGGADLGFTLVIAGIGAGLALGGVGARLAVQTIAERVRAR